MKHNVRVNIVTLVMLLLVGCFGCAGSGTGDLKILNHSMTVHEFSGSSPQSMAAVVGRAQNVSNSVIGSATITVNFYDKNKAVLATGSAAKQNLQPGEMWDFTVQTVGPDAWKIVNYDITVSTK